MATAKTKPQGVRTTFKVDTPFTSPTWPSITGNNHDIMLEMLCGLLNPLGQHRAQHLGPSKGARSRKRERLEESKPAIPAPPPIAADVNVGLNSVTRNLESMAGPKSSSEEHPVRHTAVVFLPKHKDNVAIAHLPVLAAYASVAQSSNPAVRLVLLNASTEKQLATVLGLPRVGAVGIMDGGDGGALIGFVREHVPPVDVPWIKEAGAANYLGLKVTIQESTPKPKPKPTAKTQRPGKNLNN